MSMRTYRVTASVRRQWQNQLDQAREELASGHHQDGREMTDEAKAEFAADIALMEHNLATKPVGTVLKGMTLSEPPVQDCARAMTGSPHDAHNYLRIVDTEPLTQVIYRCEGSPPRATKTAPGTRVYFKGGKGRVLSDHSAIIPKIHATKPPGNGLVYVLYDYPHEYYRTLENGLAVLTTDLGGWHHVSALRNEP